jgi:hypothetical protein
VIFVLTGARAVVTQPAVPVAPAPVPEKVSSLLVAEDEV